MTQVVNARVEPRMKQICFNGLRAAGLFDRGTVVTGGAVAAVPVKANNLSGCGGLCVTRSVTKRSRQLLETCVEALVLSYQLDAQIDAFELVCESWALDAGATRAFAKVSFTGVAELTRTFGSSRELRTVSSTFTARHFEGSLWIEGRELSHRSGRNHLTLSFGAKFGGLAFSFEHVTHELVQLYSRDAVYFERTTHHPIDFYDPFKTA